MGLEGSELMEKMEVFDSTRWSLPQGPNPVSSGALESCLSGDLFLSEDPDCQMQLLKQAQVLLKKNSLYQQIWQALQQSDIFRPSTFGLSFNPADGERVNPLHRDAAVNNLRFFNIFYGFRASTFALAVNLLDRILGKVKTHPRYLSCIATCCFHIAAQTQEENVFIPSLAELVKLSQCGGTDADLQRMENLIGEKLQWQLDAITPLTFLQYFYEMFVLKEEVADPSMLSSLIGKLQVLMCQYRFAYYRAETMALALISHHFIGEKNPEHQALIIELQYSCQIPEQELTECSVIVRDYLVAYGNQPSRQPRLQLSWTVSRRTLTKLKPSSRVEHNLEPIMEDEGLVDSSSSDDAGPFDSENDEVEIKQHKLKICPYFPCLEPEDACDGDDAQLPPLEYEEEDEGVDTDDPTLIFSPHEHSSSTSRLMMMTSTGNGHDKYFIPE